MAKNFGTQSRIPRIENKQTNKKALGQTLKAWGI